MISDDCLDDYPGIEFDISQKKILRRDSDIHHPLDEGYLISEQHQQLASRRQSNESHLTMNFHANTPSDPLLGFTECSNMKLLDDFDDNANQYYTSNNYSNLNQNLHRTHKSKSMLEVKPPNRYDSSSDSTDLELDDFNFDFEKYWNELDKTTTKSSAATSLSMTHHKYLDYRNNNCSANIFGKTKTCKEKNTNFDNYAQKLHRESMDIDNIMDIGDDITDNEAFDDDDDDIKNDCSDNDMDVNNINYDVHNYNSRSTSHSFKGTVFDSLKSPTHCSRTHYQPISSPSAPTPTNKYKNNMINERYEDYLLTNRTLYNRIDDNQLAQQLRSRNQQNYDNCSSEYYSNMSNDSQGAIDRNSNDNNHINNINSNGKIINEDTQHDNHIDQVPNNNGTISLINNIFSIYKPRKYSPVNCRVASQGKNMNTSSTVRPLGAPCNDFLTSMKRPLTIAPSCFTTIKPTWSNPSSTVVDQPHFKIIPEKTGLKISPLYRFGYEDNSKLRLKCTARPLLFPL